METVGKKNVLTSKFTGFIGLCIFMFLLFVFMDTSLTLWSAVVGALNEERSVFPEGKLLYSLVMASYFVLSPFSVVCGVLFWSKRLFAVRLLEAFLALLILARAFELVLSFVPEVTGVQGFSASLTDSILVKLSLGIVVPGLLLFYLLRPERRIETDQGVKPRSDD
jgi:hypothetical protein